MRTKLKSTWTSSLMRWDPKLGTLQKCMLRSTSMKFIWKSLMAIPKSPRIKYRFNKNQWRTGLKICWGKKYSRMLPEKNNIWNKNCSIWATPLTLCKNMSSTGTWGVPNLWGSHSPRETSQSKNGGRKSRRGAKILRKGKKWLRKSRIKKKKRWRKLRKEWERKNKRERRKKQKIMWSKYKSAKKREMQII